MLPQLFHIGRFFLPTYGVLVALAFVTSLWIVSRLSRRAGIDKEAAMNLGIYTVIAGMVGAKLLMILLDLPYYAQNPGELFSLATLQAGGIFYGGLIAALLTAYYYVRRTKLPGLVTADVFAPAVALGHGIGRVGCFAAGCCYGGECHLPWAVTFTNPEANLRSGVPLGQPLHPTQLYEALSEAVIFAILYWRFGKPHRPGTIIGLYLILYSTVRFLVEFVRAHDANNFHVGPFVVEQWIALGLAALGLYVMRRNGQPVPARAVKAR
ncbi:MAG TPA: prolipoprotein diacylglyceryl transferase [Bryobacteraceae bacterium]